MCIRDRGTTSFTSFTYSDNKKDESLAPSEGTGAISSASQKVVIFHQADGSTIIRKADSNGKVTLPAIKNETGYTFLGWSTKPDQTQNPQYQAGQVIQVRKKTHLYAVMYNLSLIHIYEKGRIARVDFDFVKEK